MTFVYLSSPLDASCWWMVPLVMAVRRLIIHKQLMAATSEFDP